LTWFARGFCGQESDMEDDFCVCVSCMYLGCLDAPETVLLWPVGDF